MEDTMAEILTDKHLGMVTWFSAFALGGVLGLLVSPQAAMVVGIAGMLVVSTHALISMNDSNSEGSE